ncbi:hypothetical protein FisN_UnNu017 [Fistulifera solaris]|uniref:Ysc84 actin-binding domain-containing protein n=1 Tax=Fistulifera solaris TaxID=1519565 RepID=A0A1Z5JAA4_FISSO|nr:hypothetical protein FisN_UnNu017 [Fistulifera solaris]|eukprot:GAX10889.1 hypothetical protein FisN_UnNu017 [Fistulifera solaris]
MSLLQRLSAEARDAMQDLYSNWVLGDDAGKSARITLVVRPRRAVTNRNQPLLDLGMTFIEINGRAYVKSVLPGSLAQKAGVLPQDAVQFAMLYRKKWYLSSHDEHDLVDRSSARSREAMDEIAAKHVLELESKGVRISYDELKALLAQGLDPLQSAFLSPSTASKSKGNTWNGPPIPATVNICVPLEGSIKDDYTDSRGDDTDDSYRRPTSPFSHEMPRPVVFVFRRTRQRRSLQVYTSNLAPLFRLDDECDFATSLVQRLAPTGDMAAPPPNMFEELIHDGTDWLLGRESMLPPKSKESSSQQTNETQLLDYNDEDPIPLDDFEKQRAAKLARLRAQMAAESGKPGSGSDVEAETIRGMIQKAVGLAFVRSGKMVLGVSLHAGTGLVIARLSDGTWSAPSAIGTWGLGFGLQFGLEVAEYIFILQTQDALEHFRRGGSFTIGGNVGIAAAGIGREAYGAASISGACGNVNTVKDDEYNDNDTQDEKIAPALAMTPIVAYAKSQGLYVGVSLEGSRIFSRDDINCRAYKFELGRDVTANDILSGKVATPTEAEDLYAALHTVEFAHEMSCLPKPPAFLDSASSWHYDRCSLGRRSSAPASPNSSKGQPFSFLNNLTPEEAIECETFEAQFKKFMYGGVSVQRIIPDKKTQSGKTSKERRTLWLMLPEVGSLRLGFVSKLSDGEGTLSNKSSTQQARRDERSRLAAVDGDVATVASEELTLDSALNTKDGSTTIGQNIRSGNVILSNKHSVALTDVSVLSHDSPIPLRFEEDKMEHLRVISVQDVSGTTLLFLANNFREAELLICGLKLLLERETTRLGVRGGLPLRAFGGKCLEGAMSPSAARGFRDTSIISTRTSSRGSKSSISHVSDSDACDKNEENLVDQYERDREGAADRKWGSVPGRDYMRNQAATAVESDDNGFIEKGFPQYIHDHTIVKEIVTRVRIPLSFSLCRELLLDSTSPVFRAWEKGRGDKNVDKTRWVFPSSQSDHDQNLSDRQRIATISMATASRTSTFDRPRYGSTVRFSETHSIESDDSKNLVFSIAERTPRRGFSIKVRIVLSARRDSECDAYVSADIRPIGKDMSNQAAVHKAFLLVVDEIKQRYGMDNNGLVSCFFAIADKADTDSPKTSRKNMDNEPPSVSRVFRKTDPLLEEKKSDLSSGKRSATSPSKTRTSGFVSLEDMLKTGRTSPEPSPGGFNPSRGKGESGSFIPEIEDERYGMALHEKRNRQPVTVEVKPLPKIRLSLMPSPREEDEEESSSNTQQQRKSSRRKKSHPTRSSSRKAPQSTSSDTRVQI